MSMPLSGIRVLDLSQALAGPASARMLGDLGAEIIKVEPPEVGEAARRMGTSFMNGESVYYMTFNRNKKGIALNLRTEGGRQVLYRLVKVSDVVLDNFRPGVMARLGAGLRDTEEGQPLHNLLLGFRLWTGRSLQRPSRLRFGDTGPLGGHERDRRARRAS